MTPGDYTITIAILERHPFEQPVQRRRILAELNDQLARAKRAERPAVLFAPDGLGGWVIGAPDAPTRFRTGQTMAAQAAFAVFQNPDALPQVTDFSNATDKKHAASNVSRGIRLLAAEVEQGARALSVALRNIHVMNGCLIFNADEVPFTVVTEPTGMFEECAAFSPEGSAYSAKMNLPMEKIK